MRSAVLYIDTSALSKWYLPEPFSDDVESLIDSVGNVLVSRLTSVEFRCLHQRKLRERQINKRIAQLNQQLFEDHLRQGILHIVPLSDICFTLADELIARMPDTPLRTLDALHLAVAQASDCKQFATADKAQAKAARSLGFKVHTFY